MITKASEHIEVEGHIGTWYVIDEGRYVLTPDTERGPETICAHCFLLEHETYGDEAACVIVNEEGTIIMEDVYNGFGDLEDAGWAKMADCEDGQKRYFYTFGSDEQFPYQNGWVEVHAADWNEAHEKFRTRFTDRHPDCLNCAFFYDEERWNQMDPEHTWRGYRCHEIIE